MYSRIPVPEIEWREENLRYALCFFPMVGAVLGAAETAWFIIYRILGFNQFLFGAGAAMLPLFITGGIHMDGFCDVCDALNSWGTRERMLEIMDDAHIGSFAAVRAAMYLLIQAGIFAEIGSIRLIFVCALTFVQSRAWSALGAVLFKSAKKDGALRSFKIPADRRAVIITELTILFVTAALAATIDLVCGISALLGEGAAFLYYRIMSYKKFGGVTGDLAGYFLEICELAAVFFAVFANLIRSAVI